MGKMNKTNFIAVMADSAGISKTDSAKYAEVWFRVIQNALQNGDDIVFPGFGTFSVIERAARSGRHPQTGVEIHIPATKVVKFKAGKNLKEAVNIATIA